MKTQLENDIRELFSNYCKQHGIEDCNVTTHYAVKDHYCFFLTTNKFLEEEDAVNVYHLVEDMLDERHLHSDAVVFLTKHVDSYANKTKRNVSFNAIIILIDFS